MKKTISVSQIKQAVNEAYDLYKNNQDGKNAEPRGTWGVGRQSEIVGAGE